MLKTNGTPFKRCKSKHFSHNQAELNLHDKNDNVKIKLKEPRGNLRIMSERWSRLCEPSRAGARWELALCASQTITGGGTDPRWTPVSAVDPRPKWRLRQRKGRKKEGKKGKKARHRKVVIGNCFWQLFVQHQNHFLCQHSEPHWKTGQVSLMSNLFQSSLVWAWQFTERLEELVITSVTGQLMHITLRHSRRWLSAPQ